LVLKVEVQTMRTTPDDLRRAANVPAYWDLAPLLNNAAKQLEATQNEQREPIVTEQIVIASVAGAIYGAGVAGNSGVNISVSVQRAREIWREVVRTEPKEAPVVQSEVPQTVVGV
jgi:hypothetical protein